MEARRIDIEQLPASELAAHVLEAVRTSAAAAVEAKVTEMIVRTAGECVCPSEKTLRLKAFPSQPTHFPIIITVEWCTLRPARERRNAFVDLHAAYIELLTTLSDEQVLTRLRFSPLRICPFHYNTQPLQFPTRQLKTLFQACQRKRLTEKFRP